MQRSERIKIGDRVVYHSGEHTGYNCLDGWLGTVVGIDNSIVPYTVRFDIPFYEALDGDIEGRPGNKWCCMACHLTKI